MIYCFQLVCEDFSWGLAPSLFSLSPIKISSKSYLEKAFGGTLISLSGLFPAIMLLPSMCVLKLHMQASRGALQQIVWGAGTRTQWCLQLHWLNGGWMFACCESVGKPLNRIPPYYNMSYIKHTCRHTLHLWKLDLNIIPNAGRRSCSLGFLVVSIQPATVYSGPNVNARGPLSFTRLCWSHTAFPCIIYIKLSPLLCIHKRRSQTSWDQWLTEIKYLCQPWNA